MGVVVHPDCVLIKTSTDNSCWQTERSKLRAYGNLVLPPDKVDQAFALGFAYCKLSETGWWEGLGTRLSMLLA